MATVYRIAYKGPQVQARPERAAAAAVLLSIAGLMQALDALSTVIGLRLGGEEANYFSDLVLQTWGTMGFLVLKTIFGGLMITLAWRVWRTREAPGYLIWGSVGLALVMLAVVSINMLQIAMALGL